MVKSYLKFVAVGFMMGALLVAGGCSQKKVKAADTGATASPAAEVPPFQGEGLDSQAKDSKSAFTILEGRTTGPMLPIYFDFDKSNVRNDQKKRMETNATYLKDNPNAVITVEGKCDEKGTNEYNMALGERRALSAKKYLTNMGIKANRINTLSYGEEKPLNFGHDELAWSQNRRADFVQNQ